MSGILWSPVLVHNAGNSQREQPDWSHKVIAMRRRISTGKNKVRHLAYIVYGAKRLMLVQDLQCRCLGYLGANCRSKSANCHSLNGQSITESMPYACCMHRRDERISKNAGSGRMRYLCRSTFGSMMTP